MSSSNTSNNGLARRSRRREESGYVAITTALLMVMLMLMAALALDVSYFYARGNQVQRAADAAALAGVTRMPQLAQARSAAEESARTNHAFQEGAVSVTADPVIDSPRRLKVTVKDSNVETFFGKLITDHLEVQRTATAEYVKRIPLGSAFNAIGTGNLSDAVYTPSGVPQQFWLAINGPCTAKEEGDQLMSIFDGTASPYPDTDFPLGDPQKLSYQCDDAGIALKSTGIPGGTTGAFATTNTEFSPEGYDYVVNIPCSTPSVPADRCTTLSPQAVAIQAYDPTFSYSVLGAPVTPPPNRMDRNVLPYKDTRFGTVNLTTIFKVYWDNNTANDKGDDVLIRSTCFGSGKFLGLPTGTPSALPNDCPLGSLDLCQGTDMWCTLSTIAAGSHVGRYRVSVKVLGGAASPVGNVSYGSNAFSLRANVGGGAFTICSTLVVGAWCPSTSGDESMGVYADAPSSATEAEFFLAQLAPAKEFRGKRIQVVLYDPGEGAQSIEILPPPLVVGGPRAPRSFNWRTWFPGLGAPTTDQGYGWPTPNTDTAIDVSGDEDSGRALSVGIPLRRKKTLLSKFNGRKLVLELNIPTNYGKDALGAEQTPLPDDGWWKIRYRFAGSSPRADRTTWTVQLVGDPVHLVHG
jgi:Flp pilus assembly protein TadG